MPPAQIPLVLVLQCYHMTLGIILHIVEVMNFWYLLCDKATVCATTVCICFVLWQLCINIDNEDEFCFLGPNLQHMEVFRLGRNPMYSCRPTPQQRWIWATPANYTTAHSGSWQSWILNPLSKAKDQTRVLMVTSLVHYRWATGRTPCTCSFLPHSLRVYLSSRFISVFLSSFTVFTAIMYFIIWTC